MMYCEKVSAKPDIGRAMIQARVLSQMRQVAGDDVAHHAVRDDGIGLGEHGAAGQEFALAGQAAGGLGVEGVFHGSRSLRRSSAMRSTCAQAVSNSACAVVVEAGLEGVQDVGLAEALHGDDEGEAELRDIGVVEAR